MSLFSGKKLILLGFIIVLLVAIPLTVYLAQQQQKTRSSAAASTILSLVQTPQTVATGDSVVLDVSVDPGQNFVSWVKFTISYDPTKLSVLEDGLVINSDAVTTFEAPVYGPSTVSVSVATGGDQTRVIQSITKIATITFTAIGPTETAPTQVTFGSDTEALSSAPTDTAKENVLSARNPASITITGEASTTTTTTTTTLPSSTTTTTIVANQSPVCTSLDSGGIASGNAPLAVTFTVIGNDSDGTVSKVTFNFGDGTVNDVTEGGGIGTASINSQANHTYNSSGTFTATAILTDNASGVSTTENCSQVITVSGESIASTPVPISTPVPTLVPTGPNETIMVIGALGAILTVIGTILLFAL
ncbi:MAG: PKD domain-containing protein [Candidatus Levyibacteriota bacterium]